MISSQILGLLLCRWAHSLYFAPQVELVPDPLRVEPNEPFPSGVLPPFYYNHRGDDQRCWDRGPDFQFTLIHLEVFFGTRPFLLM